MRLIVGLGNPGAEYSQTRHNFGFIALDDYVARHGGVWHYKAKFLADVAELVINGSKVLFAKPQTFYNLTGESVQRIRSFYKIELSDVLVIHDEMALPLGTIRTRLGGSDAGNNGIKNMIATKLPTLTDIHNGRRNYVLGHLTVDEQKILKDKLNIVDQIITQFINGEFIETTYR